MTDLGPRISKDDLAANAEELLPPLVEAKLAVPSVRQGMIDRPRVRRLLHQGHDAALTLVVAPAGYGKTSAVQAWCESRDAALAWVTLDAGDNDPSRLWRYVATAVDRVRPGLGRTSLQRLSSAGGSVSDAVDELMNGLAAFGRPFVLVLDDMHELDDEPTLASLDQALAHLPANAHVVAISRKDPALDVGRLRVSRSLTELRAHDLSFTDREAEELLVQRGGLDLGADEIRLVVQKTEGWPAALVLAGLWLETVEHPASAVREFGGSHLFVADYLSKEVLASLSDDVRGFLRGIAVLGRFRVDLCDYVLERSDSRARLAELQRANLFVSRLGRGGWFRLHPLFAEYVRAQDDDPRWAEGIHRRAADWLLAHGMPLEAVEHANAADDHEMVAGLLVEHHVALIRGGAGGTLLRWIRTLPDECVIRHPELTVAAAVAAALAGRGMAQQRRYLQLADEAQAANGRSTYVETYALVTRALMLHGGVAKGVTAGRKAVQLAAGRTDGLLPAALVAHSRALFFAGELDEAFRVGLQVLEQPGIESRVPILALARSTLALVAVEQGRLAAARRHADEAKVALAPIGSGRTWLGANVSAANGAVRAAEGKLVEAETDLAAAAELFADEVATVDEAWLLILLARVSLWRGRLGEAAARLDAGREVLHELDDSGRVPALADEVSLKLEHAT